MTFSEKGPTMCLGAKAFGGVVISTAAVSSVGSSQEKETKPLCCKRQEIALLSALRCSFSPLRSF